MQMAGSSACERTPSTTTQTGSQDSQHILHYLASETSPQERIMNTEAPNDNSGEEDNDDDPKKREYIKLPGKRAEYWNHFKAYTTKKKTRVECLYCGKTYAAEARGNGTTNMNKHWKSCVKNPANESKGTQSKLVVEKLDENEHWKMKNWVLDLVEVRRSLIRLIVGEELPFRFVEKPFLKEFVASMCPTFKVPSRWTIARDCYTLFLDEKAKLKAFLERNCQRVSVTTDTWTSLQKVNYMSLTIHFIDGDWKLQRRILNFCPISGHKGDDIARDVEGCLRSWGLADKVYTLTVDNASANDSAVHELIDIVKATRKSVCGGKYLHLRCTAHICNLIVQDGLKVHIECVDKVRAICKFIRSSPARINNFKDEAKLIGVDVTCSLLLDVPTRWNSTYKMLEIALKYKQVFNRVETPRDSEGVYLGRMTSEEWAKILVIMNFLKYFYDFTNLISGSSYVTVTNVFLYIGELVVLLNQWCNHEDPICQLMAVAMKMKCDKYWGQFEKMNIFMFVGIILDPKYKFEGLKLTLTETYGIEKGEELAATVKIATKTLFDDYVKIYTGGSSSQAQAPSSSSTNMGVDSGGSSLVGRIGLLRNLSSKLDKLNESDGALFTNEFDRYFHELRSRDSDALTWWQFNGNRFPILARLARDVLAIPVSTVPSESAFSTGGRTLSQFRSSLSPKMAEALICTQDWLRVARTSHEATYDEVVQLYHETEKIEEDVHQSNM